ncbi:hypothetical protein [Butyrivibrio sp. AE3003]|uniref:hypothetical protein n=1 Tax=Butyrivibrio sp. AE3003 TaxID=1496721 RepID=UPI00047E3AEA|nr:hypothetical protein [Butyrivibrio sp. AE3003]
MKGKHSIIIFNNFVKYKFELDHNISVIRGDSGTGKTTLVNMIRSYQVEGRSSGIELGCDKKCIALVGAGNDWLDVINKTEDSIVFIDEGEKYISSISFADAIKNTDNYYVIVSRNNLYNLPYSVDAIYEIKKSGKYGRLKQTYNHLRRIYGDMLRDESIDLKNIDRIIVEDSNSGYEFFLNISKRLKNECISSGGKSGMAEAIKETSGEKKVLAIADGAAFGPEMDRVNYLIKNREGNKLFLPESFEWLILNSGIIKDSYVPDMLRAPYDFIDSRLYFSWEQFFTKELIRLSNGTYLAYQKNHINSNYLSDVIVKKILDNYFEI